MDSETLISASEGSKVRDHNLPNGWATVALRHLVQHALGGDWGVALDSEPEGDYVEVRVIRGTEFRNWEAEKGEAAARRKIKRTSLLKRRLRKSDLVVEISGGGPGQPVGRILLVDADAIKRAELPLVCSNFCRQIRLRDGCSPRYVDFALRELYLRGAFTRFQTETTNIRNLRFDEFLNLEIPLAPLLEQKRIVAKIEQLLAHVNVARERLTRVQVITRRFRQAILAAAVSGRLTTDWRESGPTDSKAHDVRLGLRSMSSYLGTALPELPSLWTWVPLGELVEELRNGISAKPELEPPGHPILRISAVRAGAVVNDKVRYLRSSDHLLETYRLRDGDLLFTRYNGSLDLLGVCGMVRGLGDQILLYPDKLMRVRLGSAPVLPGYAEIAFSSPEARDRMTAKAKSSAGQQGISGKDIKSQPFALPPVEEQREIVHRVESLLKLVESVKGRVRITEAFADRLTQAILAKAFRANLC